MWNEFCYWCLSFMLIGLVTAILRIFCEKRTKKSPSDSLIHKFKCKYLFIYLRLNKKNQKVSRQTTLENIFWKIKREKKSVACDYFFTLFAISHMNGFIVWQYHTASGNINAQRDWSQRKIYDVYHIKSAHYLRARNISTNEL